MKTLSIVEHAYRATIEEQDDTIVWITRAMKAAGADIDILLRGNAVNYAVKAQDASGLVFGSWRQTQPPRLAADLEGARDKGVTIFALSEDLAMRGLSEPDLIAGIERVGKGNLAALLSRYGRVWHW
jgi:predicted peroxiredoxin